MAPLAEVRQHLAAALALLDGATAAGEAAGQPADAFATASRAGVQVDAAALAELVAAADKLKMPPGAVLRLALRALAAELAKGQGRRVTRLVGAERALLEGKRAK